LRGVITLYVEFKTEQKFASVIADQSPFHEAFQDAGWVLNDEDLIVDIDCLQKDVIEKMIQAFDIKTQIVWTERGCHLYFNKPKGFKGTRAVAPIGVEVEYKHIKNTKAITIKRGGKLREIDNLGVRQELPDFLYIRTKLDSLQGLDEGDGRNQKLYAHKFKVMQCDNYKKILSFINNYIFAEPLDAEEFTTIARQEEVKAEKDGEYEVAMVLKTQLKIKKYGDVLYLYDGKRYSADEEFTTKISQYLKGKKTSYIDEVIKQLKYRIENEKEPVNGFHVKFKNGILRNGKFIEIDSNEFTPHYIDWEYDPDAKAVPIVEEFLETLTSGDKDYRQMVLESVGHTLITNMKIKRGREFQKVIIYVGAGGEGKGTMFAVAREFLGSHNYSTVKLEQIHDEKYQYSTKGKLGNFGDDIEKKPIKGSTMSALKNATGYDVIEMRKLYSQPIKTTLTASHIYTSNHILKTNEKGESWKRRVLWCPMYNKPTKYDPDFNTKLMTDKAMKYWTKLFVEAHLHLYETRKFTISKVVQDFTDHYHFENNSCVEFILDHAPEDFIGQRPPQVFEDYQTWCEENGLDAQSKKQLNESIQTDMNLIVGAKKVNGKTAKVYVEKD
jgi:putative DNA primase/helicase